MKHVYLIISSLIIKAMRVFNVLRNVLHIMGKVIYIRNALDVKKKLAFHVFLIFNSFAANVNNLQ